MLSITVEEKHQNKDQTAVLKTLTKKKENCHQSLCVFLKGIFWAVYWMILEEILQNQRPNWCSEDSGVIILVTKTLCLIKRYFLSGVSDDFGKKEYIKSKRKCIKTKNQTDVVKTGEMILVSKVLCLIKRYFLSNIFDIVGNTSKTKLLSHSNILNCHWKKKIWILCKYALNSVLWRWVLRWLSAPD